jgi:hypothetical protein
VRNKFNNLLQKRREEYASWLPIYSSALQERIFFNAKGFTHLRFKTDNTPRAPKETMYKLGLLPLVRVVIHSASEIENYQKRLAPVGGTRKKILKEIEYWSLIGRAGKQNVKIKVIVRRVGKSSQIHFWSVMKIL